jgi:pimeloyl-ACP methyl ester carboxylesterase
MAQLKPLDINLENYNYPFPVKFIHLEIQKEKYKMAYMDVSPEKPDGKAILLLHGKNFNGAYWRQTAQELLKNGYRVIMPDQLGFGKSSKPQEIQYSFQQLAENTKNLLDSLGIRKIAVLGHSMGGMLAVRFTLMYPETVTKLILEDPIGLEDYKLKVPYQSVDDWYKKELKQDYESMKKYQVSSYYNNEWKPAYEEWLNISAGWTLNKDYPLIAWNSALTYDMIMTQPVVYELDRIKAPTLLIIGLNDKTALGKDLVSKEVQETMGNYPQLGRQTKVKISGSELVELEDTGHLPHIQSFDKFIKPLLDFLGK